MKISPYIVTLLLVMVILKWVKPHPIDLNAPGYIKQRGYELNGYIPKTNIVHSEIGAEK
jgi:hypothetical protein